MYSTKYNEARLKLGVRIGVETLYGPAGSASVLLPCSCEREQSMKGKFSIQSVVGSCKLCKLQWQVLYWVLVQATYSLTRVLSLRAKADHVQYTVYRYRVESGERKNGRTETTTTNIEAKQQTFFPVDSCLTSYHMPNTHSYYFAYNFPALQCCKLYIVYYYQSRFCTPISHMHICIAYIVQSIQILDSGFQMLNAELNAERNGKCTSYSVFCVYIQDTCTFTMCIEH